LLPIFQMVFMGGARWAFRATIEYLEGRNGRSTPSKPVIVLGAGTSAAHLIKDLARGGEWRVVGLLDDSRAKIGNDLLGKRILGHVDELPRRMLERTSGPRLKLSNGEPSLPNRSGS